MPRGRFTVRRMMAAIGLLAIFLAIATPVGRYTYEQNRRRNLARRFDVEVLGLRPRCPKYVSPDVWEHAVGWTQIIGPTNLYATDFIPFPARERLVQDLHKRSQGPVGPDLIPWIWDRYATMVRGTRSESNVRTYRCAAISPLLQDALSVRPNGIAADAWDRSVRETGAAIDAVIGLHWDAVTPAIAEEQDRFLDSVAAILARPVGSARLLAVWEEIAASGPLGRSYVEGRIASIRRDLGER